MRKRLKSVVAPLALLGASVALALGATEASLRVFPQLMPEEARLRLHWREVQAGAVSRADPYLGFVYPPNYEGRFERDDGKFAFTYTTDEHGFRNPSPWPEPAEIVVLGDSMAFGYGVEDKETWTTLLGNELPGKADHKSRPDRRRAPAVLQDLRDVRPGSAPGSGSVLPVPRERPDRRRAVQRVATSRIAGQLRALASGSG
jgi:hypothetical protein